MVDVPVSVVVPVGPAADHARWLDEATESVLGQRSPGDELIFVDNSGGREHPPDLWRQLARYWRSPWPLGVAVSWNVGVGLAKNELVLFLGSDDRLLPGCLDAVRGAWRREPDPLGWYFLAVEYSDGRTQNAPCHASVVTRALWRLTGGFPPEASVGMPDSVLISALMANRGGWWAGAFHKVADAPLYWWRLHPGQDTEVRRPRWHMLAAQVRDVFTETFEPWAG